MGTSLFKSLLKLKPSDRAGVRASEGPQDSIRIHSVWLRTASWHLAPAIISQCWHLMPSLCPPSPFVENDPSPNTRRFWEAGLRRL
ncbi:hypothetical protein SKAU_G00292070 [Synaphobranchus kaupii]|uniref:Uncharacterized protein n=1 Tax=Synaphobranchus kaupii TaxID=118154 RepID=A0A9Q1IM70_SYNKA|nr:hypothetical protein SKAU_G00292070 [Synaphobranchus kaupii]